jgi:hypothetical protein
MNTVIEKQLVEITATWTGMNSQNLRKGARVHFWSRGDCLHEDWRKFSYAWIQQIFTDTPQTWVGIHQLHFKYLEDITYTYKEA